MYFQGFSWDSELGILREKSTLSFFFPLPSFYFTVALILFRGAGDEWESSGCCFQMIALILLYK